MKIGIYIPLGKEAGGVYQYSLTLLESLLSIAEIECYVFSDSEQLSAKFSKSIKCHYIDISLSNGRDLYSIRDKISNFLSRYVPSFFKCIYKVGLFPLIRYVLLFINRKIIRLISDLKLDLMFYPTTSTLSFLLNVPSVVTIHDLHHRITPWFKETSAGGRWELREYSLKQICTNSFRLLTESNIGKKNIIKYYGIEPGKVVILPMLAPSYLNTNIKKVQISKLLKINNISKNYIFYPAKFWPHKTTLD